MSRRRRKFKKLDFSLDPDIRHGIFTVGIFAVAALLLLGLFDLSGNFGKLVDGAMAQIFGWDRIVIPFFLIAIGYHNASPTRLPLKLTNYIGFILFFLGLNPLVNIGTFKSVPPTPDALAAAGGKLGVFLAGPFINLVGMAGAMTLFAAMFVVSLLLIFNTSLRRVVAMFKGLLKIILKVLKVITLPLYKLFAFALKKRQNFPPDDYSQTAGGISDMDDGEYEEEEEPEFVEHEGGEGHIRPAPVRKPRKKRPRIEVPLELLTKRDQRPTSGDIEYNQSIIQKTLEHFGIPVVMGEVAVGPTVTQFTLKPFEGIKLAKITALHNDLALALAAHPIRIEAPIPGKSLVGIEVPNQSVATVGIREMLESREWRERVNNRVFALGKDVSGKPWVTDLSRMPHMLVAGATGSGKSICLNTLLMSLLYSNGPDDLKFILVDPKRVELTIYNGIPHLVVPVITEVDKTINALRWALREMDRRFDILSKFGARDLDAYNKRAEEKIPILVIVVDELADLMMTAMAEIEGAVVRLAQMSRAVGIHLVLTTQRPSVDVITGLIKANIPTRVAFAVASSMDSRTILDQVGAEKLLGRGDMLFQTAEMSSPRRIQGSFVAEDEVRRVVDFLKSKYEPADYDLSILERAGGGESKFINGLPVEEDTDPLLPEAKEEILRAGKASASLLQRRLKVGYARAARILDLLEQEGFIGPGDGAKPREILNVQFSRQMEQIPQPDFPEEENQNEEPEERI